MSPLLVAAGALVAVGSAVAIGAATTRIAVLGLLVALVLAPFVADPLPASAVLGYRIAAAALAAFLLLLAGRVDDRPAVPPLGLPATLVASLAALAAGLGATAVGLPSFGTAEALGPALAGLVVALAPVTRARHPFRLGAGLLVLANAALLGRVALVGTPPALEGLLAGAALVAVAAGAAAAAATGAVAVPGGGGALPAKPTQRTGGAAGRPGPAPRAGSGSAAGAGTPRDIGAAAGSANAPTGSANAPTGSLRPGPGARRRRGT